MILVAALVFLLFYPFKFTIWNENEYLYIKTWLITIKINMLILFDNNHNEEIKKQAKMIKLVNKVNIDTIDLQIKGLHFDYEYSGQIFGYLNIALAVVKNYLMMRNSDFNYDIQYMGEKSIKFKGIIYCKTGTILKQMLGGKKSARESN
jgi:hypothetical protein